MENEFVDRASEGETQEDQNVEETSAVSPHWPCALAFCRGLRTFVAFVISRVGLMAIVVGYCLLGGIMFEKLESHNELQVKDSIGDLRHQVADDIWIMTLKSDVLDSDAWKKHVDGRVKEFELDLIDSMRKRGWNGHESHSMRQWTFPGSLFYSIICITTIGYGNQTPKTATGKLLTIAYAVVGMPLMLFCLSHTGHIMAQSFRFLYWRVCCFMCLASARPRPIRPHHPRRLRGRSVRTLHRRTQSMKSGTSSGKGTPTFSRRMMRRRSRVFSPNEWPLNGSIPAIVDPSDFGQDQTDVAVRESQQQQQQQQQPIPTIQAPERADIDLEASSQEIFGIASGAERSSSFRSRRQRSTKSLALSLPEQQHGSYSTPGSKILPRRPRSLGGSFRSTRDDDVEEFPMEDLDYSIEDDLSTRDIPLSICLVLVIGYIIGGAVLFSHSENWKPMDSAYFCFITLTTIGFGDFVPKAADQHRVNTEMGIGLCSLYLLFGMSLLVMTFNLVQQRVVNKVRNIAIMMGIIKGDEDFDYD